jgi:hypothetical protein
LGACSTEFVPGPIAIQVLMFRECRIGAEKE